MFGTQKKQLTNSLMPLRQTSIVVGYEYVSIQVQYFSLCEQKGVLKPDICTCLQCYEVHSANPRS